MLCVSLSFVCLCSPCLAKPRAKIPRDIAGQCGSLPTLMACPRPRYTTPLELETPPICTGVIFGNGAQICTGGNGATQRLAERAFKRSELFFLFPKMQSRRAAAPKPEFVARTFTTCEWRLESLGRWASTTLKETRLRVNLRRASALAATASSGRCVRNAQRQP